MRLMPCHVEECVWVFSRSRSDDSRMMICIRRDSGPACGFKCAQGDFWFACTHTLQERPRHYVKDHTVAMSRGNIETYVMSVHAAGCNSASKKEAQAR